MPMSLPTTPKAMSFIVARDRARAKAFYGATLGLPLVHEDDSAAMFDIDGSALRISTVPNHTPQSHTVLGWAVPDIAASLRALAAKGVDFTIYEGFGQDELGIWSPPGSTVKVAWFKDPDGNVLSLKEF